MILGSTFFSLKKLFSETDMSFIKFALSSIVTNPVTPTVECSVSCNPC